jgi:hypothetical protein
MSTGDVEPEIRREVRIGAAREHVFDTLLQVGEWWPHRLRKDSAVSLEPWVGGRFMEDWGGEAGALYGLVTFIERPSALVVSRPMGMRGAAASAWTIELDGVRPGTAHAANTDRDSARLPAGFAAGAVPAPASTIVRVQHAWCGEVDAETRRAYTTGWEEGLEALKNACAVRPLRPGSAPLPSRPGGLSVGYTINPPLAPESPRSAEAQAAT